MMDGKSRWRTTSDTLGLPEADVKYVKRHSIHGITEEIDKIKPHQEIARLSSQEKQYLLAVERGDVALTKKILTENVKKIIDGVVFKNYDFNINCVDSLGRSAVLIAIENENLEMLKLLIENHVDTREALLCAISEEFVEAVETLLEYEDTHHIPGTPYSWESGPSSTALFTPDITPLVLAAHRDNYEIIKILLDKGASLPVPHDVKCGCEDCVQSLQDDCLQHSYSRINAYRALSSPSLIALSSKDPILTAFELSWELRRLTRLEHEFKSEYEMLQNKCQDFATALLDHTRTSNELQILLNHDSYSTGSKPRDNRFKLDRLKLAVKLKQKKFVAHPNVQQLLASIWYEGLPGFRRKNIILQFWEIICIAVIFPVLSVIYIFAPHSSLGQVLRKPFIKFICHSASYFTFLFLLIMASVKATPVQTVSKAEWLIMFYVYGFIWSEIKQLWSCGFQEYITNLWNILDLITNSFYVCTIVLRIILIMTKEHQHIKMWNDLLGVHEALFSMANILSALKLVYIFSINPYLGPLQIVLSRMVLDIAKFFLLYLLVLFAFSCGVYQLLGDLVYKNSTSSDTEQSNNGTDRLAFHSIFESIQTLFWSAFGVLELNDIRELETSNFIKFWGLLTWGTYCVISIVVLLNLLIAMMSTSYNHIIDAADVEWKFARSKLWISYFEEGGTTPPPFNIIPTAKSFWYLCIKLKRYVCRQAKIDVQYQLKTQLSINEFQNTVRNLVHRYIMAEQKRSGDHTIITVDDINEVRQDISSFRFELLNTLQNSGMKVNTANDSPVGLTARKERKKPRLFKGFENQSDSFNGGSIIWSDDNSPSPQIEISKRESAKFTLSGILPSIFQTKQQSPSNVNKSTVTAGANKKPTATESAKPWLHIRGKAESLEKLIERGLVTKYILRAKTDIDNVVIRENGNDCEDVEAGLIESEDGTTDIVLTDRPLTSTVTTEAEIYVQVENEHHPNTADEDVASTLATTKDEAPSEGVTKLEDDKEYDEEEKAEVVENGENAENAENASLSDAFEETGLRKASTTSHKRLQRQEFIEDDQPNGSD